MQFNRWTSSILAEDSTLLDSRISSSLLGAYRIVASAVRTQRNTVFEYYLVSISFIITNIYSINNQNLCFLNAKARANNKSKKIKMAKRSQNIILLVEESRKSWTFSSRITNMFINRLIIDANAAFELLGVYHFSMLGEKNNSYE